MKKILITITVISTILLAIGLSFYITNKPLVFYLNKNYLQLSISKDLNPILGNKLNEFLNSNLKYNTEIDDYNNKTSLKPDLILSTSKANSDLYENISLTSEIIVPITNFTSQINNISSQNLQKIASGEVNNWDKIADFNQPIKLILLEKNKKTDQKFYTFLEGNLNPKYYELASSWDKINSKITLNKSALALIPLEKLSFKTKIISVDSISPLKNPEKLDQYYLKREIWLSVSKNCPRKVKNSISKIIEFLKNSSEKIEVSSIIATGDIMLSRHVGTKIRQLKNNSLPFVKIKDFLKKADITFGNLESPFYNQGTPITSGMVFKAEPTTISGLKESGFDILSLANNHFGNQGQNGMKYTFNHLKTNGISYVGAGNNSNEAYTHKILKLKDYKIAFLSYNGIAPQSYEAGLNNAGLAWMKLDKLKEGIIKARKEADIVFVSFHWGTEYTYYPNPEQKKFAHTAVDFGADLVISHHPHVIQTIEFYKNGFIGYSLGNLVFDQMWSSDTREGLIVKIYFINKKLASISYFI